MNENFSYVLKSAAKLSFEQEILKNISDIKSSFTEVNLDCTQIQNLSEKILLLPPQGIFIFFSKYCFHFTPTDVELFYGIDNAKGRLLYYETLLSFAFGMNELQIISDDSFRDACKIALKKYLEQESYVDEFQSALFKSKKISIFSKMARRLVVAAIIAIMSFSTMLVANAEFRERVISWVIETFEKYSIF